MKKIVTYIFFVISFIQLTSCFNNKHSSRAQVENFIDTTNSFSFETVSTLDFQKATSKDFNLGFSNATHWYRLKIDTLKKELFLVIKNPSLDIVEVYFITTTNNIVRKEINNLLKFNLREIKNQEAVFAIPPNTYQAYLKVKSETMIFLPIEIVNKEYFNRQNTLNLIAFTGLHIIIFLMMIYYILLYLRGRYNIYGYYSLYLLALFLVGTAITGYGNYLIWPNMPKFNYYSTQFFMTLLFITFCLFSTKILNLKKFVPTINFILLGFTFLGIIILLGSFFLPRTFILKTLNILPSIAIFLAAIGAIISYKKKYLPAKYYLIGWSTFFIGSTLMQLKNLGILPANFITSNLGYLGATVEIFFFSYGITVKMKSEELETAKLKVVSYQKKVDFLLEQLKKTYPSTEINKKVILDKKLLENSFITPLSERELEVLNLVVEGKTNQQIAEQLFISINTVKTHVRKIYDKLDVKNRTEAVSKSMTLNLFN